ncbi:protein adenylyltransferase SelO family protein, partial [Escherichia coli]
DVEPLQAGLAAYQSTFVACTRRDAAAKLGLAAADDEDLQFYLRWQQLMQDGAMDMTLAWRALMRVDPASPDVGVLDAVYYDEARQQSVQAPLQQWLQDYAARLRVDPLSASERTAKMAAANPLYVLRNWLAQEAIDRAEQGDLGGVHALQDVLRDPYTERAGLEHYAGKRPAWADNRAGCSMLSCSS